MGEWMETGWWFVRDDDGSLDMFAGANRGLCNLVGHLNGRKERDQHAVAHTFFQWSERSPFDRLPKVEFCPVSEGRRGNVMPDADLPQADIRQPEFLGELYHWGCPDKIIKLLTRVFLVLVHCPLQTNGRSGSTIGLYRFSRGNR
jgi:hypothetical protein